MRALPRLVDALPQVCAAYDVAHYDPEVIAKREAEFLRSCGQLTGASTIAWQVRTDVSMPCSKPMLKVAVLPGLNHSARKLVLSDRASVITRQGALGDGRIAKWLRV